MQVNLQYLLLTQEKLSLAESKSIEFFPDTIPYTDDETNFQINWQKLTALPKGYFYVDRYNIKQVSTWRYYFEWLRGKFGFENHCDKVRVELSLLKYSYYGLVKGFLHETPFLVDNSPNHSDKNISLANCQQDLINYYRRHYEALKPSFWMRFFSSTFSFLRHPLQKNFIFGDSIASLCLYSRHDFSLATNNSLQLVLQLQPDSSLFVTRYLDLVINTFSPETAPHVLQNNSMMAKAVAKKYMLLAKEKLNQKSFYQWMTTMGNYVSNLFGGKAQDPWSEWYRLASAAKALDETVEADALQDFIKYEIYQKNYERAFNLILKLKNVDEQISLINSEQNRQHFISFLTKDTPLAQALAKHYISVAKKSYFGKKQLFEDVCRFASADLDPLYFIEQYIDLNKCAEAAVLYKQYPNISLPTEYSHKLAQYFAREAESYYENGKSFSKNLEEREPYYRLSLQAYKQAAGLENNSCYTKKVNIHRQLLALTIFKQPADSEEQRINQLEKVLPKYEKVYQRKQVGCETSLVPSYVEALLERAAIALQHCLDPLSYSDGISASEEHLALSKDYLPIAITCLNRALQIIDKNTHIDLWAKTHFILGDIKRFFGIDGCLTHLKQAADAVPHNPFYKASFVEASGNTKELDDVWELFPEVGLQPGSYFDWKAERWNKDKIFSKELGDIHTYVVNKNSVLQNLFGRK